MDSALTAYWRPQLESDASRPAQIVFEEPSFSSLLASAQPPSPDDFRYGSILFADWVAAYHVPLACINCQSTNLCPAGLWTHQAQKKGARVPTISRPAAVPDPEPDEDRDGEDKEAPKRSRGQKACGWWHVMSSGRAHSFATAVMRKCGDCAKVQHDLLPEVVSQLPDLVQQELPVTVDALAGTRSNVPGESLPMICLLEAHAQVHTADDMPSTHTQHAADELPRNFAEHVCAAAADELPSTLPTNCRGIDCWEHPTRYYSAVVAWQKTVTSKAAGLPMELHLPFYTSGGKADMRQVARSIGLTAQTCLRTFVKAYPAHRLDELKKGILGSHPENRRGYIVLCVDHCKGQGEMAGGGFTLNVCDVDTHELFAQEVVGTDNLAKLCLLLKEVCSLPYIQGRVVIVYYDKVTAKTAAAIKRATGAKYVLQDPWH
eukprot:295029-Rhodomonas_salina.1